MGSTSTVYDVRVKYTLDDKASSGVKGIAAATEKAANSAFSLKGALAAVGGIALLHKGKELLLDFNTEMQNLKIGMTTVMQMNMHLPFQKASDAADKLFETFQEMAKKSPLLTKDFMEMASQIAPAVSMAGGGVEKLQKMTQGALMAGLAFNVRPDQMAMDIQEMLAGNVRLTSRTARQLLASQNLDHNEFNAKSAKDRAKITENILTDPSVLASAARMSHTMSGEFSTIKDNVLIAFGEVGKPVMQEITEQFRQINTWIENHPKLIKEWVTDFSSAIKTGFETVQSIASWFVDHQDLLMSLVKAFVMFKGASIATNVFKQFTDGVAGLAKNAVSAASTLSSTLAGGASASVGGAFSGLLGILGGAGGVIAGLTLLAGGLQIAGELLYNNAEADKKARENATSLNEAIGDIPGMKTRKGALETQMAGTKDFDLFERLETERDMLNKKLYDPETLGLALRKINEASIKGGGASLKDMAVTREGLLNPNLISHLPDTYDSQNVERNTQIMKDVDATLKTIQNIPADLRDQVLRYAFPDQFGMPKPKENASPAEEWKGLGTKDINVTIQKVEVASEDPDRFVMGIVQIAENGIRHATQSTHVIPGGF